VIEAVTIGVSAGGMKALSALLPELPEKPPYAVIIVQHVREGSDSYQADYLNRISAIRVKEAEEKEVIQPGTVYMAPAGYHLLVEDDRTFSLSAETPVNYARPSIDVLFESAIDVFEERLVGIVLTGASSDGAKGLTLIKAGGGITVVQDPATAESPIMPRASIQVSKPDHILTLPEIGRFLHKLRGTKETPEPEKDPDPGGNPV
jgi:two-component system, chemotaxis family, protein-glutamate methylesterase/glutaminase